MSKDKLEFAIIGIQADLKHIKEAIDDLKKQDMANKASHSEIYKTIDVNYREDINKFATKEELKDIWSTLKTLIYTSVSQVIAILLMIIFKLWK